MECSASIHVRKIVDATDDETQRRREAESSPLLKIVPFHSSNNHIVDAIVRARASQGKGIKFVERKIGIYARFGMQFDGIPTHGVDRSMRKLLERLNDGCTNIRRCFEQTPKPPLPERPSCGRYHNVVWMTFKRMA
jgi:hypothetical protein